MESIDFRDLLETHYDYFVQHNGEANVTDGWKLSIQGKTLDDAMYLYGNLSDFLLISKCSFKFGTKKLIECNVEEQRTKLLTIYIPNGVEPKSFAELVYLQIKDYEGGEDIIPKNLYTHHKNAIYYRNDRDEYGEYVSAS